MNRCKGCKYHNREIDCCEYLILTGHKRPCPPGDQCTVGPRSMWEDFCVMIVCVIALLGVAVCYVLPVALSIVRSGWWAMLLIALWPAGAALMKKMK